MHTQPDQIPEERPESILMLDDDGRFLERVHAKLKSAGFVDVFRAVDKRTALKLLDACTPEAALVDIHLKDDDQNTEGLDFIRHIRDGKYNTVPVVLSGDRSQELFFKAARAGALDFFVKGPHFDIVREVERLFDGKRGKVAGRTRPEIVADLGYLRTFGLTRREIVVLTEFARDFPKLSDLAVRLPQAKTQLRKVFSRIYSKLGIEHQNQLVSILTRCENFDQDN